MLLPMNLISSRMTDDTIVLCRPTETPVPVLADSCSEDAAGDPPPCRITGTEPLPPPPPPPPPPPALP